MTYWKRIKSTLNINKALAKIRKALGKRKKSIRSDVTPAMGTTYEARQEDTHEWKPKGHAVPIYYGTLSVSQNPTIKDTKQDLNNTPSP